MKKLLVPTDFSTCASQAVDFAVQSAKTHSLEITLLHAYETDGNVYTDYMGVNKEYNRALVDDVHAKLAQLKSVIEETEGVVVNVQVSLSPLVDAILQATEVLDIDLVVMGTLGAGGLKEQIWGSKTASLIGKTRVPVMVIPFYYEWKKPQKFLLATNHFEKSPSVLDFLFEVVDFYRARLQVAVFTDEMADNAATIMEHTRTLPHYAKTLKELYNEESLIATHLFGDSFEETLQQHLEENEIDILVMVTYQRTGFWNRIFHPGMTKRMSYHTTIPLLVIPGTE
jgi:nucleotide-binding universal stress UspA family protein